MELKKNRIAKLFKVSVLTVDNWEKKGKINRIDNVDGLKYDISSVLKMAKDAEIELDAKKKVLKEAVSILEFEIEQEKIYFENIEKYNNAMGVKL